MDLAETYKESWMSAEAELKRCKEYAESLERKLYYIRKEVNAIAGTRTPGPFE